MAAVSLTMVVVAGVALTGAIAGIAYFLILRNRSRNSFVESFRSVISGQGASPKGVPRTSQPPRTNAVKSFPPSLNQRREIKLTQEQERIRAKAAKYIQDGELLKGCHLLESINMQRDAITVLEKNGLIDEAVAILIRLQRPNRAGAVYARNKLPLKAAYYFLKANLPKDAAEQYALAGPQDPKYFLRAAEIYEHLGDGKKAIEMYAEANDTTQLINKCLENNTYIPLRTYFLNTKRFDELNQWISTPDKLEIFLSNLPADTQTTQLLGMWIVHSKRLDVVVVALRYFESDRVTMVNFWGNLPPDVQSGLVQVLAEYTLNNPDPNTIQLISSSARALYELKLYDLAGQFYYAIRRQAMVAKCLSLMNNFEAALHVLIDAGESGLARELGEVLQSAPTPQGSASQLNAWDVATVRAVREIFSKVDPDTDERQSESPFSIAAT